MKRIRSKLNNSQGVSIIIALVFMLICLFVGGTVLTAATVNGGRLRAVGKHQQFLNERSAAMLVADELRGNGGNLKLDITKRVIDRKTGTIQRDGSFESDANAASGKKIEYTFRASSDLSEHPLQRLVVEYAVRRYQARNTVSNVFIEYPKSDGSLVTITENQFWSGKLAEAEGPLTNVIDVSGTGKLSDITFKLYCTSGANNHREDLIIDFDQLAGPADPKVGIDVKIESSNAEKKFPTVVEIKRNGRQATRYTIDETLTTITWPGPEIVKGAIG